MQTSNHRRGLGARFVLGCIAALATLLGLAEAYLRFFPPQDLYPYLGEQSPLVGIYKADERFGVTYRSFNDFAADNAAALRPWWPLDAPSDPRPIWAMFGSSFVQMEGMLADTARAHVKDRAIFNLGKNEPINVRMAQIQLLLERGLKPERIIFQMMPLDLKPLSEHPLDTYHVTANGALTFEPNLPATALDGAVSHSRLALTAWCRTGLQMGNRFQSRKRLALAIDGVLMQDTRHLFAALHETTNQHQVPVTVLLVPNYEHIWRRTPCGFQDVMTPVLRDLGFDVCDPRHAFIHHADRPALFLPDKHFSAEGNRVLLTELRSHLQGSTAAVGRTEEAQ